jgi:hypothetical protein
MPRIRFFILLGCTLLWSGCGAASSAPHTGSVQLAAVAPTAQNTMNPVFSGSPCSNSPQQSPRQPAQANDVLGGAEQITRAITASSGQTFEQCQTNFVTYAALLPFPEALPTTIHQATLRLHIATTTSATGLLSCALWLDPLTTTPPVQHALRLPQVVHDASASAGATLDATAHMLTVDVTSLVQGWLHSSTDQHSLVISGPNPGDGTFPALCVTDYGAITLTIA